MELERRSNPLVKPWCFSLPEVPTEGNAVRIRRSSPRIPVTRGGRGVARAIPEEGAALAWRCPLLYGYGPPPRGRHVLISEDISLGSVRGVPHVDLGLREEQHRVGGCVGHLVQRDQAEGRWGDDVVLFRRGPVGIASGKANALLTWGDRGDSNRPLQRAGNGTAPSCASSNSTPRPRHDAPDCDPPDQGVEGVP